MDQPAAEGAQGKIGFVLYAQDIKGLGPRTRARHALRNPAAPASTKRGELVPPMAFIPAAERYNLMPAIDRWVIRSAFATISREQAEGGVVSSRYAPSISPAARSATRASSIYVREQFGHFPAVRPPVHLLRDYRDRPPIARLDKATHFIDAMKIAGLPLLSGRLWGPVCPRLPI